MRTYNELRYNEHLRFTIRQESAIVMTMLRWLDLYGTRWQIGGPEVELYPRQVHSCNPKLLATWLEGREIMDLWTLNVVIEMKQNSGSRLWVEMNMPSSSKLWAQKDIWDVVEFTMFGITSTSKTYGVWSPKWWLAILKLLWQDGQLDSWLYTPRIVDWLDVIKLHLRLNTCMYIVKVGGICTSEYSWASVGRCWNSVNEKGVDWSWGWWKDY